MCLVRACIWTEPESRRLGRLGLLLLLDDLLGGQRILFTRLGRLQLFRVKVLDAIDEVQFLLLLFDGWKG